MSEIRCQKGKARGGGQRAEDRGRKSEVGSQKTEDKTKPLADSDMFPGESKE